jgi:adenylate cyclase
VRAALDALEQAKTALRALAKYVPLDLVRILYEARMEPVLGGRIEDVTILFSDVEGFTSMAERLAPDALAEALGAYLATLTKAIHGSGGIIDKYTGDGVMALWNTPRPCERHWERACEAALASIEATEALFSSARWAGCDRWRTRYGIHRAEVVVGHFGAPDRMSFTALGDGVNVAARLESLNKQYGTRILVSSTVEREARGAFRFRRLDRVAVKGREHGLDVFELVGRRVDGDARSAVVERYERAFDQYLRREFAEALRTLREQPDDPPSRVLASRCERFLAEPPSAEWSGIHLALEK